MADTINFFKLMAELEEIASTKNSCGGFKNVGACFFSRNDLESAFRNLGINERSFDDVVETLVVHEWVQRRDGDEYIIPNTTFRKYKAIHQ